MILCNRYIKMVNSITKENALRFTAGDAATSKKPNLDTPLSAVVFVLYFFILFFFFFLDLYVFFRLVVGDLLKFFSVWLMQ